MKIASVTFSPLMENVGGAQIPAISFKQWCDIFNVECDIIGISNAIKGDDIFNPDIKYIIDTDHINILNEYDAIFFSTPQIYNYFDINIIKKPYMFMLHGEGDSDLYGLDIIIGMIRCDSFSGIVHINTYKYFNDPYDGFYWYPCCSPQDLYSKDVEPREGHGLLYASRIRRWLNPELFIECANIVRNIGKSYMYGPCARKEMSDKMLSDKTVIKEIGHFPKGERYIKGTSFIWDVAGVSDRKIKYNRLSLSAYEALAKGYIPIISKGTGPKILDGLLIEVDQFDFNKFDFYDQFESLYFREETFEKLNKIIPSSHAGYNGVKYQIELILRNLGAIK